MEEYKYWNSLESHLDFIFFEIKKQFDEIPQNEKERLFEKYVNKYFNIWDDISCAINADNEYPPVVFAWWAEKNNIQPTYPIRICRAAAHFFLN